MELRLQNSAMLTVSEAIKSRSDIISFLGGEESLNLIFELCNTLDPERISLYKKLYRIVGDTGTYKVNLRNDNLLYIKTEYKNGNGNNHYARYWIIHLFISELLGVITPNKTHILEISSGSSGISLATACEELGYNVTVIVPSSLPEARINAMKKSRSTILKVEGYIYECNLKLKELLKISDYFATNHSEERADVLTHVFSRIAHEFLKEKSPPDYAFLAIGNGTSTEAISKVFKVKNSHCKIIGFHPDVEASRDNFVIGLKPPKLKLRHNETITDFVDEIVFTDQMNIDAIRTMYMYDPEIKNFGYSSLYGVWLAHETAKNVKDKIFFSIAYDKIDRYYS